MIVKIFKDIGLISLVVLILGLIGASINAMIPWQWLTWFFVMCRTCANLFAFMIDLPTLYSVTGLTLTAYIAYWGWRASFAVIRWFK